MLKRKGKKNLETTAFSNHIVAQSPQHEAGENKQTAFARNRLAETRILSNRRNHRRCHAGFAVSSESSQCSGHRCRQRFESATKPRLPNPAASRDVANAASLACSSQ